MTLRLVQLMLSDGTRAVAATQNGSARRVMDAPSTYLLAKESIETGRGLAETVAAHGLGEDIDLAAASTEARILAPLDHPDTAHLLVTGTGLTHLGSAESRDKMHRTQADPAKQTDSMKIFLAGLAGGKPPPGEEGVQPEWFYKGDGSIVAAPGQPLTSPAFARDGGEEPEIAGLYVIGADGVPFRLGFALGNEFSDHITERENYLYLAHSKLRPCSFGPELLVGPLPDDVRGVSRIRRQGVTIWEKPFLSGENHMSHSLRNLEAHHFKYDLFRRPGDAHVHFFGTATASFADGFRAEPHDVFEIEASPFTMALRNPLAVAAPHAVTVSVL